MRGILLAFLLIAVSVMPARAAPSISAFSEPQAGPSPVLSLIQQARQSIRLEVYMLTNRPVETALGEARRRGVNVRVMLEEHPYGGGTYAREAYSTLRAESVSVRWANEQAFTYTHEKALIVDGRTAGIFTFNLTGSGISRNREFGIVDRSVTDAHTLAAVFDADWMRRTPRIGTTHLVLSPTNARSDLDNLINGARRSLDIYAEEVADSDMENRLLRAQRRHVRVRLITSADSAGVETLRRGGVAITILSAPYVHAKAIVADSQRVFVGSENLSATSLDRNREAGIILTNRAVASVVERTFAEDWHSAAPSRVPTSPPPPVSSSGSLGVHVTASPEAVTRGQALTIKAETTAGASCTINVTYPDGYVSRASTLQGQRQATGGSVSWSWHVGSTATGMAQATVHCSLSGRSGSGAARFEIR